MNHLLVRSDLAIILRHSFLETVATVFFTLCETQRHKMGEGKCEHLGGKRQVEIVAARRT